MKHRILIVDDNPDWRRAIAEALELYGYDVFHGIDGGEALDRCRELKPDGMILDMKMPRTDGLKVLERLRQRSETKTLPVLLVTGWSSETDKPRPDGPTEVLLKPVAISDVLDALRSFGLEPTRDPSSSDEEAVASG